MKTLRLILWDHLSQSISSLSEANRKDDIILMCETIDIATHVKHHQKKIAFLFSAMRHFAITLKADDYEVLYVKLDDPHNSGTLEKNLQSIIKTHDIGRIVVTHPSDHYLFAACKNWVQNLSIQVDILPDNRFLCSQEAFAQWAAGRETLRMAYFYSHMRTKHDILMDGGKPIGGQWSYDAENRKPPKTGLRIPSPYVAEPDAITREVMDLVATHFPGHFGDLAPFYFAVTRPQALAVLNRFITERLCLFGDYQDAMIQGEPWMYHSHISFYINCGLLLPLECIKSAENAYHAGNAPLNAVEGFIRQILGWREYVRGIYWLKMPAYAQLNFFKADRKLPDFYWTGDTKMNCLKQCVLETKKHAYAHHIQRLMVLGNFALLAGIDPADVNEWFWIVYADAYEWVELPNVSGMILFADGGYLASKPYAAGGSYINKMSDYCKGCQYKVTQKNGPDACPFNYLYWDFLSRNREKLASNHRIGMMYRTYDRMDLTKKQAIHDDAATFLTDMTADSTTVADWT